MRIALLLFNIPVTKACGSSRFITQISSELSKRGHDVTVIANKNGISIKGYNFRLIEVDTPPYGNWEKCLDDENSFVDTIAKYLKVLIKSHKKYHFQLLHVQHLLFSTLIGSLFKDLFKVPFIATCHGTETYESKNNQRMLNFFKYAEAAEYITAASESIIPDIKSVLKSIKNPIEITNPSVDNKIFKYDAHQRNEIRKKLGYTSQDKVILFVGRLVKEKGILKMPTIFNKIYSTNNKVKLLIVGDGNERNIMEKKLKNLNLPKNTYKFTGLIPPTKIPEFYNSADVFLMPAVWNEPFATCVLEAISCECPAIVSANGGIAKMFKKNGLGYLVCRKNNPKEFVNKTTHLLGDKKFSFRIRKNLLKLINQKYTWKICVDNLENIYEKTIQ